MTYFGGTNRMVGDPGFFGSFGKRLLRGARGFLTGGPGGAIASQFRRPRGVIPTVLDPLNLQGRLFGPSQPRAPMIDPRTGMPKRSRRMNVGNAKALRRAIRRTDGFVRLAKSALKNTGFKIVSKSSGKVSKATMDKAVAAAHHKR